MGVSANGSAARETLTYVASPGDEVPGFEEPQATHALVIIKDDNLYCLDGDPTELIDWARTAYVATLRAAGQSALANHVAATASQIHTPH